MLRSEEFTGLVRETSGEGRLQNLHRSTPVPRGPSRALQQSFDSRPNEPTVLLTERSFGTVSRRGFAGCYPELLSR